MKLSKRLVALAVAAVCLRPDAAGATECPAAADSEDGLSAAASARGLRLAGPGGASATTVDLGAAASVVEWCAALNVFLAAAGREVYAVGRDGRARPLVTAPARVVGLAVDGSGRLLAVSTTSSRRGVWVYGGRMGRFRLAGGGVEPRRRPGRVSWGDVDGDGRIDALVLVTGRARFDARLALRPFLYGWDGARLFPKWLGSRLSRPFDDATLGDLDGDGRADLVAIERTRDGRRELAAYAWRGFGVERVASGVPHDRACGLAVGTRGRITAVVDGVASAFRLLGDRIVVDVVPERAGSDLERS